MISRITFKTEFEEILSKYSLNNKIIKISHIHFSFEHREIFEMLEERGAAIKLSKYEKIDELENEIIQYLKDNPTSS